MCVLLKEASLLHAIVYLINFAVDNSQQIVATWVSKNMSDPAGAEVASGMNPVTTVCVCVCVMVSIHVCLHSRILVRCFCVCVSVFGLYQEV